MNGGFNLMGDRASQGDGEIQVRPAIVAVGPNPWAGPWMNRQQLLSRLAARGWPVVYTTGPLQLWQRRSEAWREAPWLPALKTEAGVKHIAPGRLFPVSTRVAPLRILSLNAYSMVIRRSTSYGVPRILYFFGPHSIELANYVQYDLLVYHAYDNFTAGAGGQANARYCEDEMRLLKRCDLVVASSEPIADVLRARGRRDVRTVPNGADFRAFSTASDEDPSDVRCIPRPRLGYLGRINAKLDLELVDQVAATFPQWHWVLIGDVQDRAVRRHGHDDALTRLYARHNVHFLGHKPYSRLPSYAHAMDILTMFYRTGSGGWWQAVYPLKMHDYLATGKPVISTPLPTIEGFSSVIDIRTDKYDWIAGIRYALDTGGVGSANARQAVAAANSWDARVDQLEGYLRSLCRTLRYTSS